jgi:hypothetical protein
MNSRFRGNDRRLEVGPIPKDTNTARTSIDRDSAARRRTGSITNLPPAAIENPGKPYLR